MPSDAKRFIIKKTRRQGNSQIPTAKKEKRIQEGPFQSLHFFSLGVNPILAASRKHFRALFSFMSKDQRRDLGNEGRSSFGPQGLVVGNGDNEGTRDLLGFIQKMKKIIIIQ